MNAGVYATPPAAVSCVGQSFLLIPGDLNHGYVIETRARLPANVPIVNYGIGGMSWNELLAIEPGRSFAAGKASANTSLVMIGGTRNIVLGQTGAQFYAANKAMADGARAAGYDYVIGTTTPAYAGISGTEETNRLAGNALLIANGDAAFSYVVDIGGDALIQADILAGDGIHWTGGVNGSQRGALLIWQQAIQPILTSLGL